MLSKVYLFHIFINDVDGADEIQYVCLGDFIICMSSVLSKIKSYTSPNL